MMQEYAKKVAQKLKTEFRAFNDGWSICKTYTVFSELCGESNGVNSETIEEIVHGDETGLLCKY